jgi:acyl-CoA synthetase (AMP-forming)/AMP-acid ligase II
MSEAETLPHVLLATAQVRGEHPAIIEADRRITYAALADAMLDAARAFVHSGLEPGDRVAIWAHNGIDWVVACLGAQAAGGIVVPLNTRLKAAEAQHALAHSGARYLVHSRLFIGIDFRAMLEGLDLPELRQVIAIPTVEADTGEWGNFIAAAADDFGAEDETARRLATLTGESPSDILFTSGTTGAPKGVITLHGQNVRTYREWNRATSLAAEDRYALIWPFFHCSGYKSGWLASLLAGATLYPQAVFETDKLVQLIANEKITMLPGPPTLFQSLLESEEARAGALSSLRVAITGATMVAPALIESMHDDLGIERILTGYGLTECCGTATMTSANDPTEILITSPGKAIAGSEIAIKDGDGTLLGPGQEGEVVIRGDNVMQGYYNDPEATAEAIDAEGWLHTGDIGKIDDRGYLFITGRQKDVYIVGGFNCYPAEIEAIMAKHPAVAEVAVVGVPDHRMGEVGKAFVVPRSGGDTPDPAEIIVWCRQNMANFKVPRSVVLVDALPRTSTGKVQKFRLQAGEFG